MSAVRQTFNPEFINRLDEIIIFDELFTHELLDVIQLQVDQINKTMLRRSEEHTSELQSQSNLVCRLLLEKKKKNINHNIFLYTIIHYLLSTYYIILLVLTHISLYRPPCIHDT